MFRRNNPSAFFSYRLYTKNNLVYRLGVQGRWTHHDGISTQSTKPRPNHVHAGAGTSRRELGEVNGHPYTPIASDRSHGRSPNNPWAKERAGRVKRLIHGAESSHQYARVFWDQIGAIYCFSSTWASASASASRRAARFSATRWARRSRRVLLRRRRASIWSARCFDRSFSALAL